MRTSNGDLVAALEESFNAKGMNILANCLYHHHLVMHTSDNSNVRKVHSIEAIR